MTLTRSSRVIVIGGGVVGLACARALRAAGAGVEVIDPGQPRLQAGWAAGGMLAPLAEAPGAGRFLDLAQRSLSLYPRFVADLESEAAMGLGLHLIGKLLVAFSAADHASLRRRFEWQSRDGHDVEWLDGTGVRALEPALTTEATAGLLIPGNGRIDNRALVQALEAACRTSGVDLRPGRVEEVLSAEDRVAGVRLADGSVREAPRLVLAAGAWSAQVGGLPRALPVRPVKGQMLAIAGTGRPLRRVVTSPDAYLIPRETDDGPIIVVGATEEDAGFDLGLADEGQARLHAGAVRLAPILREAPVVERWAGLRPGTPDGLPILGPDPSLDGLCYATGHHRNGILLAPVTAERVRAWYEGRGPEAWGADPFGPERFEGRAGTPAPPSDRGADDRP